MGMIQIKENPNPVKNKTCSQVFIEYFKCESLKNCKIP